jgi:hypothetical protein
LSVVFVRNIALLVALPCRRWRNVSDSGAKLMISVLHLLKTV